MGKVKNNITGGIAYWLGEMLVMVLMMAIGVLFIKGKNWARIVLGVLYCISFAVILLVCTPILAAQHRWEQEQFFSASLSCSFPCVLSAYSYGSPCLIKA